jgi:hypothetical protein
VTDLDQQIRSKLDHVTDAQDSRRDMLAAAIRAVLELPPMRTAVPDTASAAIQAGYNQALADVRVEIADRLGIQPPPDGADWAAERHSGAAMGAVVEHVERQVRPGLREPGLCPSTYPGARPPNEYRCSRDTGHPGPHEACVVGGQVVRRWIEDEHGAVALLEQTP